MVVSGVLVACAIGLSNPDLLDRQNNQGAFAVYGRLQCSISQATGSACPNPDNATRQVTLSCPSGICEQNGAKWLFCSSTNSFKTLDENGSGTYAWYYLTNDSDGNCGQCYDCDTSECRISQSCGSGYGCMAMKKYAICPI